LSAARQLKTIQCVSTLNQLTQADHMLDSRSTAILSAWIFSILLILYSAKHSVSAAPPLEISLFYYDPHNIYNSSAT